MDKQIDREEAIRILKELLRIPSVNGENDERNIARFVYQYLLSCGIEATIHPIDDKHANVVATMEGKNQNGIILLNGHMDTVPYGNLSEWNTDPEKPVEKEDRIYARGASDMKSGLAAMLYMFYYMKETNRKPQHTIRFIATCDEEKGGLGAQKIIEEAGIPKDTKLLLIGEPTNCDLGVAQKGCIWLNLVVNGKISHGAYPEEGINAIDCGYEVLMELKAFIQTFTHSILQKATAQITKVNGGIAPNMTPDRCEFLMDIRTVPSLSRQTICNKLMAICEKYIAKHRGELSISYDIINDRKAIEVDVMHPWVSKFRTVLSEKQDVVKNIGINYFTDASILVKNHADIPVLLFGPGNPSMCHKANEYVEIDRYIATIEVFLKALL